MTDRRFYYARIHRFDGTVDLFEWPSLDGEPSPWIDVKHDDGVLRRYVLAPERAEFDIYEYMLEQVEG